MTLSDKYVLKIINIEPNENKQWSTNIKNLKNSLDIHKVEKDKFDINKGSNIGGILTADD